MAAEFAVLCLDTKDDDADQGNGASTNKKRAKKQEKKLGKKQAQYRKALADLGVDFSESDTPYLFVANGGLDNGVDRETLVSLLAKFGTMEGVVMQKHKSYALVEFTTSEAAGHARLELNGLVMHMPTMSSKSPLYLIHMTSMPRHFECGAGSEASFSSAIPTGLKIVEDFISEEEERRLVDYFGCGDCAAGDGLGRFRSKGLEDRGEGDGGVLSSATDNEAKDDVTPGAPCDDINSASNSSQHCSDAHAGVELCSDTPRDGGASSGTGSLKHRRVAHYGYEFRYGSNDVDPSRPLRDHAGSLSGLPSLLDTVLVRMTATTPMADSGDIGDGRALVSVLPDQLTVNDYLPGQGIPPHVDTSWAFEDDIVSLSLLSPVVMDFRHADGRHVPIWLPRRSLMVMSGESRYAWSHGITPRQVDCIPASLLSGVSDAIRSKGLTLVQRGRRLSLTFRKIIKDPERPGVVAMSGTSGAIPKPSNTACESDAPPSFMAPKTEAEAVELETKHVYEVYDSIASHFSSTRHTPWPKVVDFLSRLTPGSFMLDVGCGNGKYMNVKQDIVSFGCDRSIGLTRIAKERGLNVAVADILNLPYRSDFFDACICIAVVHHLTTRDRRLRALRQLLRVTRRGGSVLVYVWAQEQEKCAAKGRKKNNPSPQASADTASDAGTSAGPASTETAGREAQRSNFAQQDVLVPWKFAEPGKKKKEKDTAGKKVNKKSRQHCRSGNGDGTNCPHGDDGMQQVSADMPTGGDSRGASSVECPASGTELDAAKSEHSVVAIAGVEESAAVAGGVYQRFYHVFVRSELQELCEELSDIATLVQYYHDKGNWCAVLEKK